MTINILELDQVYNIADKVYFDVINKLNIYDKCVQDDPSTDGTMNTQFGTELYYSIEDSIKSAIDYQGEED